MVKITNGKDVFEVTRGAFDGIYSRQGYVLVEENKSAEQNDVPDVPEMTDDEKFILEIIEKPLSQWNKDEIKRFAVLKNIDISGTKNAGEAKELIKQFLELEEEDE